MSKVRRVGSPIYTLFPTEVDGSDALGELVLDMRWSWNHTADEVWSQLDPDLWALTHNEREVILSFTDATGMVSLRLGGTHP